MASRKLYYNSVYNFETGPQSTSLQALGENCSIDKLPTNQKNESTNRSRKDDLLTQEQYQKNLNIKGPQSTSLQALGENCSIDKLPTIQKNESTNRSRKEDLLTQEQNDDLALPEKNLFEIDQHSFNIDLNINEKYLRNLSFLDIYINNNTNNFIYSTIREKESNFLTATLNTDGICYFKSSPLTIWPIYLSLNQIKISQRYKLKNQVFGPIINELKVLEKGIVISGKIFKLFITNGIFDKPARSSILNTIQFNGSYGCIKCYQPGCSIRTGNNGTVRIYPFKNYQSDKPLRTHEKYINDVEESIRQKKIVHGVKGPCLLNELKYYFPIESTIIDYMHSVLEGVVRRLLIIKPPKFIPRTPRDLKDVKKWKANELFSFLVYYSLPILEPYMPIDQFEHYTNLVVGIEYLLRHFVRNMDKIYKPEALLSGVHELIHLTGDVARNGDLNDFNCFSFEDLNRQLGRLINGTSNIGLFNKSFELINENDKEKIHKKLHYQKIMLSTLSKIMKPFYNRKYPEFSSSLTLCMLINAFTSRERIQFMSLIFHHLIFKTNNLNITV
ncbi:hypothetical protein BpHYR1_030111 [Brachionus plicatilis]|uniref:Uncharacterized protein n=1 Tax=Brachionus plicatilis TaxID=10195 RepID=A0A3M7PJF6_BRAPC|nr:hypothetical protein BpHYR1_030111 [Brachionus plicatilis]